MPRAYTSERKEPVSKKITLFCMTEKGYRVLETIISYSPEIIECVVSSRDPNIGQDYYDQISTLCKANDILFYSRSVIKEIHSPIAIAVSWRWLIQPASSTLLVFHDSILPKYRGFAPLVSALINGEKRIGVTALIASDKYDCGDIIAQSTRSIEHPIKIAEAIKIIHENYKEITIEVLDAITNGIPLNGVRQNESKASYSLWLDESDYHIDWSKNAEYILRFIYAVGAPYKGAFTLLDGKKARVLDAKIIDEVCIENRTPGKVIYIEESKPVVVCGKGLLMLLNLVDDETQKPLLPLTKLRTRFE